MFLECEDFIIEKGKIIFTSLYSCNVPFYLELLNRKFSTTPAKKYVKVDLVENIVLKLTAFTIVEDATSPSKSLPFDMDFFIF